MDTNFDFIKKTLKNDKKVLINHQKSFETLVSKKRKIKVKMNK